MRLIDADTAKIVIGHAIDGLFDYNLQSQILLHECIDELCLNCGQYRTEHLGSCDGCKWYKIKRGEH